MKNTILLLLTVLLAVGSAWSEVADSYQLDASRSSGIVSDVAIDIVAHGSGGTGIYLATGRGVNFSLDNGFSWRVSDGASGLQGENLSAIFAIGNRLWVGGNHEELISEELYSLSDGLSYSDDFGETWTQINFGEDGLDIDYVWGGDRTIYDITGHYDEFFFENRASNQDADWLFFAAFAGGFLASQDGGQHWRRIFPSTSDSLQYYTTTEAPSYRNRYFSCVADTSHGDSLFVWTGTAGGIFQYVFVPPRSKLYSESIYRFTFCDTCSADGGTPIYMGGSSGVSVTGTQDRTYRTFFEVDGIPGQKVTAIANYGPYLLAGVIDSVATRATVATSTDGGATYTETGPSGISDLSAGVTDFAMKDGLLYVAAGAAGLWVSADTGQADWTSVIIEDVPSSPFNIVHSLSVLEDTLLVGTEGGLAELYIDGSGAVLDTTLVDFPENDSTSARIVRVKPQFFENDVTPGTYDSIVVWSVHHPTTESGAPVVMRRRQLPDNSYVYDRRQVSVTNHDVNFFGDTAFVLGELGARFTTIGGEPTNFFTVRQYVNDTTVVGTLDNDTLLCMEVRGDTVAIGARHGVAISTDRGRQFQIRHANLDTLHPDFVVNWTYFSSDLGLTGDFVPVISVQYQSGGGPAKVWASTRPVSFGNLGIGVGEYDGDGDLIWSTALEDDFAWNFAFADDTTIFAGTNAGLMRHNGTIGEDWDTIPLYDPHPGGQAGSISVTDPYKEVAVYATEIIDDMLWVGTDDGTVRLDLDDLTNQQQFLRADSTTPASEVYAFPVPFSPKSGGTVDFHFVVDERGPVTLEVYDFAMNLVARPIDNIMFDAGIYPGGSYSGFQWDGRNGEGDVVAVGVYYFKVELPGGDIRWGKLAVLP